MFLYGASSNELLESAPESIQLNFIFQNDKALEAEKKMNAYLIANYDEDDLSEFYDYISNIKFIIDPIIIWSKYIGDI